MTTSNDMNYETGGKIHQHKEKTKNGGNNCVANVSSATVQFLVSSFYLLLLLPVAHGHTSTKSVRIATSTTHCFRYSANAAAFEAISGVPVQMDCMDYSELHPEILSDVTTQTGYYDGFIFGPHATGDMVMVNGLHDLTPFVQADGGSYDLRWNDLFRFNRENAAVYDKKVVLIPLDGDVISLYYRADLFKKYNKSPPTTWEEYTEIARFFHEKVEPLPGTSTNETITLSGSCVGRKFKCQEKHWIMLILSSMTQHLGTDTGFLFDPDDMEPLLGEAFVKTLQFTEEQFAYGADNELEGCFDSTNIAKMQEGSCAMTYNWGDEFSETAKQPPTSYVSGLIATTHTPGSKSYLDRKTQKLVQCIAETCSCNKGTAEVFEGSTPCVNIAPYAAFTGWSGGVNNYVNPSKKNSTSDFFAYTSSPEVSLADTIPNITAGAPHISCDPFRTSQTNVQDWVDRGLPEQPTISYLSTIREQQSHTNIVQDMRIANTPKLLLEMQTLFHEHLLKINEKKLQGLKGDDLFSTLEEKWEVERRLRSSWKDMIDSIDKELAPLTLLEMYQRSLSIYAPKINYNYIGSILRWFGWTLATIVVSTSLFFAGWVCINRKTCRVVKASQPLFLLMICSGALLIGVGIFPLAIDDEIASIRGCNIACMSWPWLFSCGFVFAYSALFSKISRVVKIFNNPRFKRITVKESDVIRPLLVLLGLNISLLLAWTFVDPLVFKRIQTSPTSSIGQCRSEGNGKVASIFAFLIVGINIFSLVAANIQAYRARRISDEFAESSYIAITMISILQAIIIVIPLSFLIKGQPKLFVVVIALFAFIVAMSLLLLMFVPKFILQKKKTPRPIGFSNVTTATKSNVVSEIGISIIKHPEFPDQMKRQEQKLAALKLRLEEEGVNASILFKEVGLDVPLPPKETP